MGESRAARIAGSRPAIAPIEPVDLTALTAESVQRAHVANPLHAWQANIARGLVATGDPEMLRRALDNLLANVAAHSPAGTTATITAVADGNGASTIEVSDNGPGVPAEQLARIFDRFYRGRAGTHPSGSGLGLAIVAAIATDHNGDVQATPNKPTGLRVTLSLPGSQQLHPVQAPTSLARTVPADGHLSQQ